MDINIILKNIPYIVFFLAIVIFIIGLSIKEKKILIKEKLNLGKMSVNAFYKLCDFIYNPNKEFTQNIAFDLRHLNPNYTIYKFFGVQLILLITVTISCILISFTDASYKEKQALGITNAEIANNQYTEEHELYYNQFRIVEQHYNLENIIFSVDPKSTMYDIADFLLSNTSINNYNDAVATAVQLYNDMQEIYEIRQHKVLPFVIFVLWIVVTLLYFTFINIALRFKLMQYERDLPLLKTTTFLLGSLQLPVQNIMIYLSNISASYNFVFKQSLKNFGSLTEGQDKAIMKMTEYANFIHFRKLCDALREMLIGDKKKALNNLGKDIEMEEKEVNMRIASKIEKNSAIAIVLLLLVYGFLFVIMMYPIFKYMLDFSVFEYI